MKNRGLFLIFLISSVLCEGFSTVVLPEENLTVSPVSFLPSALEELETEGIYVLFDDEGFPFGFIENGTFTSNVTYGNLTLQSYAGEGEWVIGGSEIVNLSEEMAAARLNQGIDADWELLQETDFTKYTYYSQRYDSLEDFLVEDMSLDTLTESVQFLNSLDPSLSNEMMNIFEAALEKKVGYSHYSEILDALEKINDRDLKSLLDPETVSKLEEFTEKIKNEIAEKAVKEILENFDKEDLKLLYDMIKRIDKKQIYEIARDYMRSLARDGTLDKIGESLKNIQISDEVKQGFSDAAKKFLTKDLVEFLPKNAGYYLLAAGALIFILTLRRVGG
jgi:hypothetical protein